MRVKDLKDAEIKKWLKEGIAAVEDIKKKELEITSLVDHATLYALVLKDLEKMGYKVGYDNDEDNNLLFDENMRQSIPAITLFDEKMIILNENFPILTQYEILFHEYIHIKLRGSLPTIENMLDDNKGLHDLENSVDITVYILIMPPEEVKQKLLKHHYKINNIFKNYEDFEKHSVLQWISIISHFACHFAWAMINKKLDPPNINYDNYFYDHVNDPREYVEIDNLLKDSRSAAAQAVKKEKNAVNKESFFNRNEYICYAYYEKGLNRNICTIKLEKHTVQYDRLLVIGWEKSAYAKFKREMKARSKQKSVGIIFPSSL